ncbi:MAG: Bax inhibitor-1/YccA family protein [Rhodomicrobiaceae bacterium]
MTTPDSGLGWQSATAHTDAVLYDEGLRQHMLRVYNYMGLGLVVTGLVAFVVGNTPALYVPIFTTPLKWVVMLAPLAFVLFFSFRMQTISASGAQTLFWAFCGVMGLSLASVFLVFTGASIARTFFIAAAMFGTMSLYGYTTKRDLSKFGSFLIMGLIGVIIASLVNLFVQSSALQFAVSVIGILVFVGLTAWDTQRIKEEYAESVGHESLQKMAVFGAFSLYLNFINIFTLLLNFTGERE